jgi:BASS family bile acid:Na+ symporter
MFGLGMNNNGTGLVLAATALSAYPRVLQPVILYNLVQHLVAAGVAARLGVPPPRQPSVAALPVPARRAS